ncbi:hypothetical protein VP01_292g11 [Puccinia sorghi]|uniref:Uncharacterized protein n=1 Tax=Puccinia sorghi TaxID=27349 RepID=A0A0L6V1Z4_9BASI|nr:hypothetical protein VP01_292g11 [Puccinia sorghi]
MKLVKKIDGLLANNKSLNSLWEEYFLEEAIQITTEQRPPRSNYTMGSYQSNSCKITSSFAYPDGRSTLIVKIDFRAHGQRTRNGFLLKCV